MRTLAGLILCDTEFWPGHKTARLFGSGCSKLFCPACPLAQRKDCFNVTCTLSIRQVTGWLQTANPDIDSVSLEGGEWVDMRGKREDGASLIALLDEMNPRYHVRLRTRGMEGSIWEDFHNLARVVEFLDFDLIGPEWTRIRVLPSDSALDLERMTERLRINLSAIRNTLAAKDNPDSGAMNRFKHPNFDYRIHTTVHPYTCELVDDLDKMKADYIDAFNLSPDHWYLHKYKPHARSSQQMRDMVDAYTDAQLQEAAERLGAVYAG